MKTETESRDRAESLPYRPCVGITLINRAGLVFVGRRGRDAGPEPIAGDRAWQMPQGGIDAGEAPQAAALRELHEETNVGAASVRLLAEAPDWLSYDLPPDVMKQVWRGRYRGQTQRWFAFGFLGKDSAIDVDRPGGGGAPARVRRVALGAIFRAGGSDRAVQAPGLRGCGRGLRPARRMVGRRVSAAGRR